MSSRTGQGRSMSSPTGLSLISSSLSPGRCGVVSVGIDVESYGP